jgi:hypothetical protein
LTPRAVILLGVGLAGLAGCSGHGRVELVSLTYTSIDPPAPRVARIDLDHCYWWTDAAGQVWVAMEREFRPLFGEFGRFHFQMSLRLERPPSGKARNYFAGKRELRAWVLVGPIQNRLTSAAGIVALYREPGDHLRGSFRLLTRRVVNRWLGGWGRPSSYLMLGTFEAVHDEDRGRRIAAASESFGWEREEGVSASRPAATQPVTRPAAR